MQKTVTVLAALAMASGALAQVNVNISGVESRDGQGAAVNVVMLVNLGTPNAEVLFVGWDLSFTPNAPSWTSEPHMTFGDSAGSNAYDWDMGNWGGVNNSNPLALNGQDATSFFVGGDGLLRIELWEDFVDFSKSVDVRSILKRKNMVLVSAWNNAVLDRYFLRYNFRPKAEWPPQVCEDLKTD